MAATARAIDWSVDQVEAWVESIGLERVAPLLKEELVDGEALFQLEEKDLSDLGLKLGERRKLQAHIKDGPTEEYLEHIASASTASTTADAATIKDDIVESGNDGLHQQDSVAADSHSAGELQEVKMSMKRFAIIMVHATVAAKDSATIAAQSTCPCVLQIAASASDLAQHQLERVVGMMKELYEVSLEALDLTDKALRAAESGDIPGMTVAWEEIMVGMNKLQREAEAARRDVHEGSEKFRAGIKATAKCLYLPPIDLPPPAVELSSSQNSCQISLFLDRFESAVPSYLHTVVDKCARHEQQGETMLAHHLEALKTQEEAMEGSDRSTSAGSNGSTQERSRIASNFTTQQSKISSEWSEKFSLMQSTRTAAIVSDTDPLQTLQHELNQLDTIIAQWEYFFAHCAKCQERQELVAEHVKVFLDHVGTTDSALVRERLNQRFGTFKNFWKTVNWSSGHFLQVVSCSVPKEEVERWGWDKYKDFEALQGLKCC
jgi:hypothetical protein